MLCVYAFKQLVGANEIDYHLSAQKIGNIVFLNIYMNEMQHQQYHIWFKGKKLENKAHK